MEAWRVGDPALLEHPIAALSAATLRWGLGPIPHNIFFADNLEDWPQWVYFPCGDNNDKLCSEIPTCQNISCLILIEKSNRTTIGPAGSNIVGLAWSLTVFNLVLVTLGVIFCLSKMKSLRTKLAAAFAKREERKKGPASKAVVLVKQNPSAPAQRPSDTLTAELGMTYNRPLAKTDRLAEFSRMPARGDKAKELARVVGLLKEMYALDLKVWSMSNDLEDNFGNDYGEKMEEVRQNKERSNELFADIRNTVRSWAERENVGAGCWAEEEKEKVDEIVSVVFGGPERRYDL
ncbi:hypothetical protein QBC43DRAFT_100672 [Cladorrhinum sp. PSN259]|nr:hypothetical protein QBC43DRAFT_100672 [Cladorrhinum sp. PSN259]